MVYRPADTRLLTNLLSQEKEYSKQLNQLLDSSNASLASFAAYAAASPPPASNVIMAVAESLAAADEALRRYARGVDEWRETMKLLKDTEDEVGNIMRDRDILVTRVLKASKKSTSGNFRDSLLLSSHQRHPSSSSLSLSVGHQDSPSPPPSRPLSTTFSSSSKQVAAQSELQACETHLAAKERELAIKRCAAVRDGLGARMRALSECGWLWGELGKEALLALEELKVENMERQPPKSQPPQQRRPPLIDEPHTASLPDSQSHAILVPEPDSTRPSSDFSSIGPSQSASQVGEDIQPLPVSIGSIMNSGFFGDPTPRTNDHININDDTRDSSQSKAALGGARPPSGLSIATGSSIYYSPATEATYKLETMTYAPAVAVHVPGKDSEPASPPVGGGGGQSTFNHVILPAASELFKDDHPQSHPHVPMSTHTNVRIPAPHALGDGYAYEIPTAEHRPVAEPSGLGSGQQSNRTSSTPSASGHSTPQRTSSFTKSAGASQQLVSAATPLLPISTSTPQRHVLERRITEEEIRRASADRDRKDSSSTEEEVKVEKKLVKEGKLAVVENPRFMSEARRKEVEREREEEEEKKRKEKGKEKEREVEEDVEEKEIGKEKEKEKKRFSFFHSSHPHPPPAAAETPAKAPTENGHVKFADEVQQEPFSPSLSKPGNSPSKSANQNPSPSKGFLGSLRGFFGVKHPPGQSASVPSSPVHSRSRSLSVSRNLADEVDSDSDIDTGLQGIFHLPSGKKPRVNLKKEKGKEKGARSSRWETRTNKNIRELAERRGGSFDEISGVGVGGVGGGIAGDVVANAGVVHAGLGVPTGIGGGTTAKEGRGRAASDVGGSPAASPSPGGRKLKKTRGGPPVSASAALAAFAVGDTGSLHSTASSAIVEPSRSPIAPPRVAPARAASAPAKAPTRRSASVDVVEGGKRRSWVEKDEKEREEEERRKEANGMIVDLGQRRRAASETGGKKKAPEAFAPPPPPPAPPSAPVSVFSGRQPDPERTPAKRTQGRANLSKASSASATAKTKGYSSDTDAMVASAPAVTRKKSLTKKRAQESAARAAPMALSPPILPVHPISTAKTTTSTPASTPASTSATPAPATQTPPRKPSLKTSTSITTSPSTGKTAPFSSHHGTSSSTFVNVATVLPAGGDHPSGTLVSGWGAQANAALSRNSSIVSAASAPAAGGGGVRGKKQMTLGQGMGGSGALARRSSMGGGGSAKADAATSTASVASGRENPPSSAGASGSVVQPAPTVPSLMSIVEDVARGNREGWNQDLKMRKSVGGTQRPIGMMELGSVKAPPPVKREVLATLDPSQIKARAGAMGSTTSLNTVTTATAATTKTPVKASVGMFEIKAPGSVFDARPVGPVGRVEQAQPAPSTKPKPKQDDRVWPTGTPPRPSTITNRPRPAEASGSGSHVVKPQMPLRSALRNTSRSPSPAAVHLAQTQRGRPAVPVASEGKPPPPVDGTLPWGTDGTLKQPLNISKDKGKAKAKAPAPPAEDADGTSDTGTYETGNEYYSDQEEVEQRPRAVVNVPAPSTSKPVVNGIANGYPIGYRIGSPKAGSELSHSTTSTLIIGSSGQLVSEQTETQRQTTQTQAQHQPQPAASTFAVSTPRRRKSVRVSLQPTFSPSPPAIEYDYEEEQRQYAPWGWHDHEEERFVGQPAPLPAPIPVQAPAAREKAATDADKVRDMWENSSEEEEHYAKAKRLLTRAAKREKDVHRLVANRA